LHRAVKTNIIVFIRARHVLINGAIKQCFFYLRVLSRVVHSPSIELFIMLTADVKQQQSSAMAYFADSMLFVLHKLVICQYY